jgi:hypothetical protein
VIFGTDRVVIYVEPKASAGKPVAANTARTNLLMGGEPLDWAEWAVEFRDNMPEELKCVFRIIVTDRFGIVTAEFGNVTGHFGDVTEAVLVAA